ncbi:MAG: zf-TFIIB domain-containing protein [Candidatus Wildermuthbacteria bacterium]|nr:zf-TFIIB domain-containing protein [Candidatus Wildermuthbacteria bacterium]
MKCPVCKTRKLEQAIFSGVEVDYCPRCYGLWFEEDELQFAKDEKDRDLRWLDIDLWENVSRFRISPSGKLCPQDRMPLYEVHYSDSVVKVDLCNLCHGIWLDRGEFKDIIAYLKAEAQDKILYDYLGVLKEELWEVFSGPEMLKEEVLDVFAILKLLRYKFAVQHPTLARIISALPR